MSEERDEMGPIDYLVIEWPGGQPTGGAAPLLVDLVDRGLIRVLDLAFVRKAEDGAAEPLDISELAAEVEGMSQLIGAASGLLDSEDLDQVANALDPGSAAGILVYENAWAGPFAAAVRRGGGELVANGRIPVQSILAALDAVEEDGPSAPANRN
ncbi:MAG TPA: DUF6325 family protein [Solirubrobacterales bacterium]